MSKATEVYVMYGTYNSVSIRESRGGGVLASKSGSISIRKSDGVTVET